MTGGRTGRGQGLFAGALLLAAAFAAHGPAITRCGWIWDDDDYVTHNPLLVAEDGLARIWLEPRASPQWYPLVFTTFRVERALWGLDPRGFHATNVALHGLSALLLWRLLRRLRLPGGWLAAALFACHPLQVESVAWVTERKNVLSLALALASAHVLLPLFVTRPLPRRALARLAGGALLFGLALLSKSVVASLPAALLVVAWWRGRLDARSWAAAAPLLALGAAAGLHTAWVEQVHVGARLGLPLVDRVLVAGRALSHHARTLVWPAPASFVHPRFVVDATDPRDWLHPLGWALALALLWWRRDRLGRGPLAATLVFAGVLAPALGLLEVYPHRFSWVADHFAYHATPAGLAGLACGLTLAARRRGPRGPRLVGAALVAAATLGCWARLPAFADEESLWRTTLAANPGAVLARTNLARVLAGRAAPGGPDAPALRAEAQGLLRPLFAGRGELPDEVELRAATWTLAWVALQAGDAEDELRWAKRLEAGPLLELVALHRRAGDDAGAARLLLARREAVPEDPVAATHLAHLLATSGDVRVRDAAAAERLARDILARSPGFATARSALATALAAQGRVAEALAAAREALAAFEAAGAPAEVRAAAAASVAHLEAALERE